MRLSRIALAALGLPLLAGCYSNETLGPRATPSGGTMFSNYIALGTSIAAGVQSGGINDSTQKRAYPALLAQAMGLTVGVNWFYPSFTMPGCPPPFTNPLTGARVTPAGYPTSTALSCYVMNPAFASPLGYENNLGVPSIRAAQVLNIRDLTFPKTDSLLASQFITGSRNPIDIVLAARPTFVTLEIGANDVLGAATHGDASLLTPVAAFETQWNAIADSIKLSGAKVAVSNIPNVTVIPHFSAGVILYCLHNGGPACPAAAGLPPATPPFSSLNFVVDNTCLASAAAPGLGVGDSMLVAFPAIAQIAGTLTAGGAATLNCGAGTATVNQGAGFVPAGAVLTKATTIAIVTNVLTINGFLQAQATTRGWAFVDLNGLLASKASFIPKFPNLATPDTLFGVLFSLDGIHPTSAGHKAIADAFVAAINAKYSTTLTPP
jgi:lysophospholipase L1-like esterase